MSIRIISPGVLTTVQDGGRFGMMEFGIGQTGAMDSEAYRAANYLVGNDEGQAVLEATFYGPTIEFLQDTVVALTGADMVAQLGDRVAPLYEAFSVKEGQRLTLGFAKNGCRAYIAIMGGIDVPKVMNSRSTDLKCKIGGFEGRALKAGDVIEIGERTLSPREITARSVKNTSYLENITVRVILGPQAEYFTEKGLATFLGEEYTLTNESDRMGMRLDGTPIENANGVDIVSDGIVFGSVQIPPSGKPIIMMADHQTTGGYAKIATVATADLSRLAQLKPGAKVKFQEITIEEGEALARESLILWQK